MILGQGHTSSLANKSGHELLRQSMHCLGFSAQRSKSFPFFLYIFSVSPKMVNCRDEEGKKILNDYMKYVFNKPHEDLHLFKVINPMTSVQIMQNFVLTFPRLCLICI